MNQPFPPFAGEGGERWKAKEGARAIVVGDVHGCAEELDLLLKVNPLLRGAALF